MPIPWLCLGSCLFSRSGSLPKPGKKMYTRTFSTWPFDILKERSVCTRGHLGAPDGENSADSRGFNATFFLGATTCFYSCLELCFFLLFNPQCNCFQLMNYDSGFRLSTVFLKERVCRFAAYEWVLWDLLDFPIIHLHTPLWFHDGCGLTIGSWIPICTATNSV